MTYTFNSRNSSVSIILDADSDEEAWIYVEHMIRPEFNDFRLDGKQETTQEDE